MNWKPLPEEKEKPEPRTMHEAVHEWAREYSAGDIDAWATVVRDWVNLVGNDLADHTEPQSLRNGELVVMVDDPAWISQLGYLADQLRAKLNDAVPGAAIESIKTRLRPAPPSAR